MDKGIKLQKELAMGQKGAKAEAMGNRTRAGKFACGGPVATKKTDKKAKK